MIDQLIEWPKDAGFRAVIYQLSAVFYPKAKGGVIPIATTRLIPMHKIKNQSVAYTVRERIDYAINLAKTLGGELVMAYGCDPATAANEMLLVKLL